MKTVKLGKTGLEISRVGFGGIPIQRLTEEEAIRVVQHCIDLGVTFLDTANGYTHSEERIGKAVAAMAGRREQIVIATKTGARDRATAWQHLELSLERLQTDYVDLWQLHNVATFEAYEQVTGPDGALEAARQALDEGKVRHIGVTSHSMDVAMEMVPSGHFETLQFPFNFVTNEPVDKLLPLVREHDLGFIAMKPFAGGMLDDANLAIKYLLQFDDVVPDPGIETSAEMKEIVGIVRDCELTPQERQEMEHIRAEVGTRFCRRCEYCQPCPEDVRISLVINLRSFSKRFAAESFSSGWIARGVESARNCTECGECEKKCPYHLPIREMIVENLEFYDSTVS